MQRNFNLFTETLFKVRLRPEVLTCSVFFYITFATTRFTTRFAIASPTPINDSSAQCTSITKVATFSTICCSFPCRRFREQFIL